MKLLILGAAGLIGHKLFERGQRDFDVHGTINHRKVDFAGIPFLQTDRIVDDIDVTNFGVLEGVIRAVDPDVILNCVGITKRKPEIENRLRAIAVNSLFPHKLRELCASTGKRLIHFSTDCVFDGTQGNYNEESVTTAQDTYGQTKALGEVTRAPALTLRSSFIGRELRDGTELLEWLLSQNGERIKGFTRAMYSGISTMRMADIVFDIIKHHRELSGLYQLATVDPISKFELLCTARDAFGLDIEIEPDADFETKPTLDGSKLRGVLDLEVPDWKTMLTEIAADQLYAKIKP